MTTTKRTVDALTNENKEVLETIRTIRTGAGYEHIDYIKYLLGNEFIKRNDLYMNVYCCYERPSKDKISACNKCEWFAKQLLRKLDIDWEYTHSYGIVSYNKFMFKYEIWFRYKNYEYAIFLTDRTTKVYIKEL